MAKLYLVGTPIGNLKDITLRALEVLRSVSVIACEDTRHSLPLLNAYGISAKLVAYHKFNEAECSEKMISMILAGEDVALISDAGMPAISDPGAELVRRARESGVHVESVPGPTALTTAVALSGLKSSSFTFLGFLPEKTADKVAIVSNAALSGLPLVLYVAPHDLKSVAAFLNEQLGNRRAYVVREITKIFESVTITELANFEAEDRGEIVLIIEGAPYDNPLNKLPLTEHIEHYLSLGLDKKDAVKQVAKDRGVPKNVVYQASLTL